MSHKSNSRNDKFMWGQPPSAVRPGKAQQLNSKRSHSLPVPSDKRICSLVFATVLASVILLPFVALAQKPAAPGTETLPAGSMQSKATTACLECHEARIILQQRLSKGAWVKEVDKMIKWGAVVDANDHDALVDYLSANFGVDQPPYEPSRTTTEKSGTRSK